ncbi:defensin Ec-AMP-D1-like [Sesamum indicum]|uniref:Defensin Ec-AMP-D1-like n=1 Tax=Sesamum indicum TaxID=4182 RepID=A0A6I9SL38_SESIN|nr:defensin Ec-AMP-D1-like [Sesamum indicum]
MKYLTVVICVFSFMLLLMIQGICPGAAAEGLRVEEKKKTCLYKSKKFGGICIAGAKCDSVCKREGFQGGKCRGLRRRCYCFKPC